VWWFLLAPALAHDLDGTWRVDLHLVHDVHVPVLGRSRTDAYTVQLWRVDGRRMVNEHCSIRAVARSRIGRPTIPPAFVEAIRHAEAPLTVDGDQLSVDMGESRIGFDGDTLPTRADDPTVVDHEGDGHPGATITVWAPLFGNVPVYIVQRSHLLLDGVIGPDGVAGTARQTVLEQQTVGAGNRLFVQTPTLTPVEGRFSMVRVPAGASCRDPQLQPVD